MDPLSITVSIIAIIGVGGQVAKTIKQLAAAQRLPHLAMVLSNERSDLYLTVTAVQQILEAQQPIQPNCNASISSSLKEAHEKIIDLKTIHDSLVNLPSKSNGSRAFDNFSRIRDLKKIGKILQDLWTVRLKLVGTLGILNLYVKLTVDLTESLHLE